MVFSGEKSVLQIQLLEYSRKGEDYVHLIRPHESKSKGAKL
jgi:hypothetical protein